MTEVTQYTVRIVYLTIGILSSTYSTQHLTLDIVWYWIELDERYRIYIATSTYVHLSLEATVATIRART